MVFVRGNWKRFICLGKHTWQVERLPPGAGLGFRLRVVAGDIPLGCTAVCRRCGARVENTAKVTAGDLLQRSIDRGRRR